jgi:RHS repeat-associated protein
LFELFEERELERQIYRGSPLCAARVGLSGADGVVSVELFDCFAHGFVGDAEVVAFVHESWCPAHDAFDDSGTDAVFVHDGGDGAAEGVGWRVDLDACSVDEAADSAAEHLRADRSAGELGDQVLLTASLARGVFSEELFEGWVERHEPELAAFAVELHLLPFEVDLSPAEAGCFAQAQSGEGEEVDYVYYDAHGNQVATADGDGDTVSTQTYDPWGVPGTALPSDQTSHAYVGADDKQTDSTTGLILMGARPYDPATGRFLSVDPIDGGSLNNYDYAGQDPIDNYDLDGTCGTLDVIPCGLLGALKSAGHHILGAAIWLTLRVPGANPDVQVEVPQDVADKIAQRHGLPIDEVEAAMNNASGEDRGFTYFNKEGVRRLGYYDQKSNIFSVTTLLKNGKVRLVTAFKVGPEYVARQKARLP